jgi:undecaprenyl diphosphate synthase
MDYKSQLIIERLPKHVAVIMDGNGRWAKKRGNQRIFGHKQGIEAVREVAEACVELGIEYLTLYAFSTENWSRPQIEVDGLMSLIFNSLTSELETLLKNDIKLETIGDISALPTKVQKKLNEVKQASGNNKKLKLILALSYSSRWELIDSVKKIASDIESGKINTHSINEDLFKTYLTTASFPDPELMIRTSGEYRISNFLLWQLAYSELYFTETLWPDFGKPEFYTALYDYQNRERRFGKTSEQINQ